MTEECNGEIVRWVEKNLYYSGDNGWSGKPTGAYIWTVNGLAESLVNKYSKNRPNDTFEILKVTLIIN